MLVNSGGGGGVKFVGRVLRPRGEGEWDFLRRRLRVSECRLGVGIFFSRLDELRSCDMADCQMRGTIGGAMTNEHPPSPFCLISSPGMIIFVMYGASER